VDLDEVADALYGVPPEEFTEARNRRAGEARDGGDRALADAIRGLRRPTTSAWLANLLVRMQREELDQLLALGASLREAQASLAGDALRALSRQRRQLVSALARQARGLAADEGHRVSGAVAEQLEQTLEAALADEEAAAAVASGRLTAPLRMTGMGEVDVTGAVATTELRADRAPERATGPGRTRRSDGGSARRTGKTRDETAAQRAARDTAEAEERRRNEELARARDDAADSEAAAREAEAARDERHDDLARAREQRDALTARAEALEEELARLRAEETTADRQVREAQRGLDRADRAARDAAERHRDARARLDRLEKRAGGTPGR
jgi:hypothetical protein